MSLSHYSKYKTYSNMKQGEELTFQYWKSVLLFKKTIIKKIINNTMKLLFVLLFVLLTSLKYNCDVTLHIRAWHVYALS